MSYKDEMKYITILDFGTGIVHQLTIDKWDIDNETCEEFMERIGFDHSNCHWMVHTQGGVQFAI